MYEKYAGIKILTCHDALYVPLSFKVRVQDIWDKKMKELVKNLPFYDCEDDLDILESFFSIFEEEDIFSNQIKENTWDEDDFFEET